MIKKPGRRNNEKLSTPQQMSDVLSHIDSIDRVAQKGEKAALRLKNDVRSAVESLRRIRKSTPN
jgi:hypothetical protein